MSAARRGGGAPSNAAARGGALILAAIVVGALLLGQGYADEGGLVATTPDDTEAPSDDTATDDGEGATDDTPDDGEEPAGEGEGDEGDATTDTTTAEPEVRPNEQIHAVVLNGSGVNGAAGAVTDVLNAANFVTGEPDNVPGNETVENSQIFYAEGWQTEAEAVAATLGASAEVTAPLPPPFDYDMGEATILVVLGTDALISAP